ncbi:MAG TPA: hypothetical protein VGL37_01960 [Solirubrobacteraceae bacterium]
MRAKRIAGHPLVDEVVAARARLVRDRKAQQGEAQSAGKPDCDRDQYAPIGALLGTHDAARMKVRALAALSGDGDLWETRALALEFELPADSQAWREGSGRRAHRTFDRAPDEGPLRIDERIS